jgi:LEA14-like dessication related protein
VSRRNNTVQRTEESVSMPKLPQFRRTAAAAAILAITACTGVGDLQTPTLEVVSVQMLSTDMFAQRFTLRMHVQNPNNVELPVKGIDYKLILMGDQFAEGMTNEPFVLPALGEAEFDMTVTTNFVSSFGRLISRMGGGRLEDIDYELAGTLMLDKGFVRKIPFNKRGTVDFTRALEKTKAGT